MKLVVDSSIFVAAFREGEPYSREAFRILEKIEEGSVSAVIPVSIVLEVVAAIRRRTNNHELAQTVGEKLLSFSEIILIDIDTFRMAKFMELASESGLRGMDVIIVGVAQEFGMPILTLDQEMATIARSYIEVVDIASLDGRFGDADAQGQAPV